MQRNGAASTTIDSAFSRLSSTSISQRAVGLLELLKWHSSSPGVSVFRVQEQSGDHRLLANLGYGSGLLDYLGSDRFLDKCDGFRPVRFDPGRSHNWDSLPGFRSTYSAQAVFMPAGFKNGLSMYLGSPDGRPLGLVHMALGTDAVDEHTRQLFEASRAPLLVWLNELDTLERARLTPREREVCNLLRSGEPNAVIAARLHVSVRTVTAHVEHILQKLNLNNRTQIAVLAERGGFSHLSDDPTHAGNSMI